MNCNRYRYSIEVPCERCGALCQKTRLTKFTIEEKTGRTGASVSFTSYRGNHKAGTVSSGRDIYRYVDLLLCADCLAQQKLEAKKNARSRSWEVFWKGFIATLGSR